MTEGRPAPGDTRPHTLPRPPGDRYAPAATANAGLSGGVRAQPRDLAPPNLVRAALFGLLGALWIAALIAVAEGALDLDFGLIAVAAVGGWAIGRTIRVGAWPNGIGLPARAVRTVAIGFAIGAWLAGQFGAYLLALLLRPDSSLTFGERLAHSSFMDWLSPQFGGLQVLELFLIAGFAWFSARPGEAPVDPDE